MALDIPGRHPSNIFPLPVQIPAILKGQLRIKGFSFLKSKKQVQP